MDRRSACSILSGFLLCFGGALNADPVLSGGATTVFQSGQNAFSLPLANLSRENRRAFVVGNSFFKQNWVIAPASAAGRDGLGPLFHARSCSACHLRDGRGALSPIGGTPHSLIIRLSVPGDSGKNGAPLPDPVFGHQLAPESIPGTAPEGQVVISYEEIRGRYDDGTPWSLQNPVYTLTTDPSYRSLHPDILTSPRLAPPVFGLGLLEAVASERILVREDPDDADRDGISGRANRVRDDEAGSLALGRFGWKANQPTIRQQVLRAFADDLGITSSLYPTADHLGDENTEPELDAKVIDRVTLYQQALAPPARRDLDDATVREGELLFREAKCSSCHVETLQTTDTFPAVPELAGHTIHPYTDLLLHDMGDGLSDGRADHLAGGNEWRTPPLWGIGLTEAVTGETSFLHDGRARNLSEAILWHEGEAEASRNRFLAMTGDEREALIRFLESL